MKTAVSIPDDLFHAAEREAKRRGVSRSKLIQMAIEALLTQRRDQDITAALNRSRAAAPEPADPFFDELARRTMANTEWNDAAGRNLVGGPRRTKRVGTRVQKASGDRLRK